MEQRKDELLKAAQIQQQRLEFLKEQRAKLLEKLTTWIDHQISQAQPHNEESSFPAKIPSYRKEAFQVDQKSELECAACGILSQYTNSTNEHSSYKTTPFQIWQNDDKHVINCLEDCICLSEFIFRNLDVFCNSYVCFNRGQLQVDRKDLEYLKLTLLVAGDVETNPEPRRLIGMYVHIELCASTKLMFPIIISDNDIANIDDTHLGMIMIIACMILQEYSVKCFSHNYRHY